MTMLFPSAEFDDAVAAVCHGQADDEKMRALHALLRSDPAARDEYLLRVELHSRLASEPALFASVVDCARATPPAHTRTAKVPWVLALAASFVLLAAVGVGFFGLKRASVKATTSLAVAVLSRSVDVQWEQPSDARSTGTALEPGWLRLKAGWVQVAFYSGARVVIEGPARVRVVSASEAFCEKGRLMAEVPPQARGFRVDTPQLQVVDLGTEFGVEVTPAAAEVHVFKGEVEVRTATVSKQSLKQGEGVVVAGNSGALRRIAASSAAFVSLADLGRKAQAMQTVQYDRWRAAGVVRNRDPSLLVHFDFENMTPAGWTLHNAAGDGSVPDAAIVGGEVTAGRWPGKRALEFRTMSDRVRFDVPGEFQALTLSTWVNVQGLDREFNSLFMCDGFASGKIHWQIRHDGSLDLGVRGATIRRVQIFASPPVVGLDQFGQWMHLAVVIDGANGQVTHYVNGAAVSRHALTVAPPYRLGPAELGNWNAGDFPNKPPSLIRHFSGTMDEFALFDRALSDSEIQALNAEGRSQPNF